MTLALSGKSRRRKHLLLGVALLALLIGSAGALGSQRSSAYAWSNTLSVVKVVEGGAATPADFLIHVKSGSAEVGGSPVAGSSTGTHYGLEAGTYSVSETGGPAGYTATFSGACDTTGKVVIVLDVLHTCTITNTFTPPATSTLTVVKHVDNTQNAGATAVAANWQLSVKKGAAEVAGSPQAGSVTGSVYALPAGDYTVSESGGPAGYTQSWGAGCPAGVAHVTAGTNVTCVLTNRANAAATIQYKVTIGKFVAGAHATEANTGSASFNMAATWTAANLSGGATASGAYALGPAGFNTPNAYEAVTSPMDAGAAYATHETGLPTSSATCGLNDRFYLMGYGTSTTSLAAAAAVSPLSSTAPNFVNLAANQYVAVVNAPCPLPATFTVTVAKFVGGVAATSGSFTLSSTTIASNIPGCNAPTGCTNAFTLNGAPYTATTSAMAAGSSYSVTETGIGGTCTGDARYRVLGYRQGANAVAAAAAPLSQTAAFTNIQANGYVIVYNEACPSPPLASAGKITVQKIWSGNANSSVGPNASFTSTGAGLANFTLMSDTAAHSSQTFSGLSAGVFSFNEAAMTGWTLQSVACTADAGSPPGSSFVYVGAAASVTLAANAKVTCVFTNKQDAPLVSDRGVSVVKVADPAGLTTAAGPFTVAIGGFGSATISVGSPASPAVLVPVNQAVLVSEDPNSLGYTTVGFALAVGGVCPGAATDYASPAGYSLPAGASSVTICVMNRKLATFVGTTPTFESTLPFILPDTSPVGSVIAPPVNVTPPLGNVTSPRTITSPVILPPVVSLAPPVNTVAGVVAPAPQQVPAPPAAGNSRRPSSGGQQWTLLGIIALGASLWIVGYTMKKRA